MYEAQELSLGGFVTLTNVGAAYDAISASRGLGLVSVDFTNVESLTFGVKVSKVGTGTQSWQLWDETTSLQIAVIDDAGAAGDKTLTTSIPISPALTGRHVIRVRAKSTVAADDPLYYGAYLILS